MSVSYAEFHYAECRYAECRYAECRGAFFDHLEPFYFPNRSKSYFTIYNLNYNRHLQLVLDILRILY